MNTTNTIAAEAKPFPDQRWVEGFTLTDHALCRMHARRITYEAVAAAIEYGEAVEIRGATIFVLGRKDVRRVDCPYVNLRRFEGVQVVCSRANVLTVYRNQKFTGLRRSNRHGRGGRQRDE